MNTWTQQPTFIDKLQSSYWTWAILIAIAGSLALYLAVMSVMDRDED